MLKEGIYTLSELRAALKESEAKGEFKPKLGDGVEKGNKKNNEEAVEDITKDVSKYNKEKPKHTIVLPNDRNKTTIDLDFNELKPGKEWYDRVEAQAGGYPSVENKKNSDAKDNGGLEYEGNEAFYKHREKLNKDRKQVKKDDMDAGLKGRELKKYNVVNENFDPDNDYMTTPDIEAKRFVKWVIKKSENASTPSEVQDLIGRACSGDEDAVEELTTMFFEETCTNTDCMEQYDDVAEGVKMAIEAFRNGFDNNLNENKKTQISNKMKRLHYKKTTFLTEEAMLKMIPEEYKTDGNKFYVKDASGTEYLVECKVDKTFDYPTLTVVNKLNEGKTNGELDRMKQLFGYESANYFKSVDKKTQNLSDLSEQLERVKKLMPENK